MLRLKYPFEPVGKIQARDILVWKTEPASPNHILLASNGNLVTVLEQTNGQWVQLFHWDIPAPILQWHQADNLLLVRVDHGLQVYRLDLPNRTFISLGENAEIASHCEFGQFYWDKRDTGAVTVDWSGKVQFYKLVVVAGRTSCPMRWLRDDHFREQLVDGVNGVFVREIREELEVVVVVGRTTGISIFTFDEKYYLVRLMKFGVGELNVKDLVFVPNDQEFRNIILVGENSTLLYHYQDEAYSRVSKSLNHLTNLTSKLLLSNAGLCFGTTSRGMVCLSTDSSKSTLDISNLKPKDRLAQVLWVCNDMIFVKSIKGNIFVTSTYSIDNQKVVSQPELPKTTRNYPTVELPLNESFSSEPRVLSLADIVTVKSFAECVNVKTGKLCFSLPLVQIVNPLGMDIVQRLDYIQPARRSRDPQGILGCGWRLELNYICLLAEVAHGAHRYVWNRNGVVLRLEGCGQGRFTVQGMPETKLFVEYLGVEEKWVVQGDRFRYVFGGQAVQRTVRHADYSGPVVGGRNLVERSVAWYLTEVNSDQYVQRYSYELEEVDVEQHSVTHAVLIKQMTDSLETCITFEYDSKNSGEYQNYLFDHESNLPILPFSTKFLNKLMVDSKQFRNCLQFQYSVQDNIRYLQTIKQFEEMVSFSYTSSSVEDIQSISMIILPDNSTYAFQYEPPDITQNISSPIEVPVQDHPKLHQTSQNMIVSYIGEHQLCVEIYDRQVKKRLNYFKIGHRKPLTYILKAGEDHVVVSLVFETGIKQISLLTRTAEGRWERNPSEISINDDELFKFGNDFAVIYSRTSLKAIYRWTEGTFELCKIPNVFEQVADLAITTTDDAFLMCCNKAVWMVQFCSWKNCFEFRAICELDPKLRNLNAFDALDCTESEQNVLIEAFLSSSIYVFHNVIVVADLQRDESCFHLVIQLYHLNECLTIIKSATFKQFITRFEENFDFFNQEIHVECLLIDGKLQIKLKNLPRGVAPSEEQTRQCYERLLELLGKKIRAGLFQLHQTSGGFRCGDVEYLYDGQEWSSQFVERSFPIDESLTFIRNAECFSVKNSKGMILFEDHLQKESTILSGKHFIAYQTECDSRYVLLNSTASDRMVHTSLPHGEQIFSKTDHMLVTLKPSNVIGDGSILTFHNLALQHELLNSLESFRNVYQYAEPEVTAVGLIFHRTTKIPQQGFGYVRYEDGDREEFYSESNEQVLVRDHSKSAEESIEPKSILYDSRGKLEIVDCSPYCWEKQQICYYGFEQYERLPEGWDFGGVQVVRNGFAGSGQSFGRIGKGGRIVGHVTPKDLSGMFRFVCLVRPKDRLVVGEISSAVTATIGDSQLNGRVISRNNSDWYTIELEIFVEESNATITISSDKPLEIDHFWFAPLDFEFKAKIYDPIDGSIAGEIDRYGRSKRFFYDICQRQAVATDFDGKLDSFVAFAESSTDGLRLKMQIQPKRGFVESFEGFSQRWMVRSSSGLSVQPYRLLHVGNDVGLISLIENVPDNVGIGFGYSLHENSKLELNFASQNIHLQRSLEDVELVVDSSNFSVPCSGTILILFLEDRLVIALDGSVLHDQVAPIQHPNQVSIQLSGTLQLEMLRLAINPLIRVQYIDASDCVIQELKIINGSEVDILESVYDHLHRLAFQTVWTRYQCPPASSLIRYYEEFVDKSNPFEEGTMRGLVHDLNPALSGFPYYRYHYENAPVAKQLQRDMPGTSGDQQRTSRCKVPSVLERMYPREEGFSAVCRSSSVKISDDRGNTVALYEKFAGAKARLSSFAYDAEGRMIAKFSPLYHERVETLLRGDGWKLDRNDQLQQQWGSWYEYDREGRVVEERGPDKGTVRYRYEGKLLVEKQLGSTAVRYSYDRGGELRRTSCAGSSVENFVGKQLHGSENMCLQRRIVSEGVEEVIIYDLDENLLENTVKVNSVVPKEVIMRFEYVKKKLSEVRYPEGSDLHLIYSYDPSGRLVGIGDFGNPYRFIRYSYDANGLQTSQIHCQSNGESFARLFAYNNAFYPTVYEDPFMKQTISYGEDSYGGLNYDYKKVTAIQTDNTWLDRCDPGAVRLNTESFSGVTRSEKVYNLLQEKGMIDSDGIVTKSFYPDLYPELPMHLTSDNAIQKILLHKFPKCCGYRCDYGIENQLIRAKYFTGDEKVRMRALTVDSFNGLEGLTSSSRDQIWRKLVKLGVIIEDNVQDHIRTSHGKKGRAMLNEDIKCFLDKGEDLGIYYNQVENLILYAIAYKMEITREVFFDFFMKWNSPINSQTYEKKLLSIGDSIWTMLSTNRFLDDSCLQALSPSFRKALSNYAPHFRSIVRILHETFAISLGTSPADVESYDIDSNGNHGCFRTGSRWFSLSYSQCGNRLESVTVEDPVERGPFRVRHDERGNVVEARHKGIAGIEYDVLVSRASKVILEDGRTVQFSYNSRGERVLKRVEHLDGSVTERVYARDDKGRCLVDYNSSYSKLGELQDQVTTYYIYDDRRLVGFKRDNLYYNVLTDHEGSIRLVLLNGQVMAAYDYMPYGQIMRKYEVDGRSGTIFRFTGQEYDEELKMYNYHARLYDPELGRFLQVDPLEQYASPYKYAGNSPLDMVDPDGRFAFLIPLAIVGGAYLGGLIYNSSAKPWEWDWHSRGTYLSIAGGAATGGIFSGILGLAGTGLLLGAYLGGASAEDSWFPRDWKWDKSTWFGIFAGGASGVLLPNSWASLVKSTSATQSTLAMAIFGGVVYAGGNYALNWRKFKSPNPLDWDWSHPGIYYRMFAGLTMSINVANSAFTFVNLLDQMTDCVNVFGVLETAKDSAVVDVELSLEALAQNRELLEQAFPHAIKALTFFVAFMK
uniref:Uncharacterized protein n=1 Tax=Culex quinquefasciatus TaxID=7176 RepID=A0A1S4JCJ9_CULQU